MANANQAKSQAGNGDVSKIGNAVANLINGAGIAAQIEMNLIETMIKLGLISRDAVDTILSEFNLTYDPAELLPESILCLIAIEAGTSLRQMRLRFTEEFVPVRTTKVLETVWPENSEVDGFAGHFEIVLSGFEGAFPFPVTDSVAESISKSLYQVDHRCGLSEYYEDFLPLLTSNGSIVFVNRSSIQGTSFIKASSHVEFEFQDAPHSEDLIDASYHYFDILEHCLKNEAEADTVLSTPLLSKMCRIFSLQGQSFEDIISSWNDRRPSPYVEFYLRTGETLTVDPQHLDLTSLDDTLAGNGTNFAFDHICGRVSYDRHEVQMVIVPAMACPDYANKLETEHYQSMVSRKVLFKIQGLRD